VITFHAAGFLLISQQFLGYSGKFSAFYETHGFIDVFTNSGFGGLVVSMLASGTASVPLRRIFSPEKILSMPSFRSSLTEVSGVALHGSASGDDGRN
jgi:hypothetical protein